jgi:DNA-binding transcriptional LysR family regulator
VADLNDIAVFVRVAQFESFSRAAHALGMPVSTVSRKVTALEERLGVTLRQRTTRKLSLTAQGRAYYNQCNEPLSHLFDAERVLTQTQKKPEGLLRISAPVHPWPGDLLCIPVLIPEDLSGHPGRPVHHQPFPGSDRRKHRRRHPLWRTAGFEPDRAAHRKERALRRRRAGISGGSPSAIAA